MSFVSSIAIALMSTISVAGLDDQATPPPSPADSDSPLAQGWPGGTMPGQIEVKSYPAYRSAVAKVKEGTMRRDTSMFFSLFNHIQSEGIAMTTPVVNTYPAQMIETPDAKGEITMEFIYRTPDMGEAGEAGNGVEVVDHKPQTYVCIGYQGQMGISQMQDGVKQLRTWLEEHADEWREAGKPRRLGYHGPMTPMARRLWEVQIPIEKAD